MNQEKNNLSNENLDNLMQDAQGQWDDADLLTSSPLDASFHTTTMAISPTLSTIENDTQIEHDDLIPLMETICISSPDDPVSRNEEKEDQQQEQQQQQQQQQQQMTSILSEDWIPPAASTPLLPTTTTTTAAATTVTSNSGHLSEQEMENELFQNIENLVREFIDRTNRGYPYYRVIRWTVGEEPKLEYVLTVIINRPAIVLE